MNKISIIIPILNEEDYIGRLIEHLLDQCESESNIEIIVVDGGSTDRSEDIIQKFDKVQLLNSEKGRAKQMNLGAKHAHGNILYFFMLMRFHRNTSTP